LKIDINYYFASSCFSYTTQYTQHIGGDRAAFNMNPINIQKRMSTATSTISVLVDDSTPSNSTDRLL